MNKKGLDIKIFGAVIIAVALLIIIILFYKQATAGTDKIIEDSECKSSIEHHALLLSMTKETITPNIYCPTKYYTLPGKNNDDTKYQLVEALKSCWGTWGRGNVNLFKEEGYYCHMCSVIDFDNKNSQITGFSDYLADTPYKSGQTFSYLDYLAGYSSKKADPEFAQQYRNLNPAGTIDTSKTYAVMFLYAKGNKFIKSMLEEIGSITPSSTTAAGGAVLGGVSGALTGVLIAKAAAAIGIGIGTGGAAIVGIAVIGVAGFVWGATKADEVEWFSLTTLQPYDAETLKQIGCQISATSQEKPQE